MTQTMYNVATGLAILGIGYLIYFDQRRQRDPAFRKRLREDRKKAELAMDADKRREQDGMNESMNAVLRTLGLDEDVVPTTAEERQRYLQQNLSVGEQLLSKGPQYYRAAATCLFRALKVYPDPVKLLMAFQETIPGPVFEEIMAMMAAEKDSPSPKGATVQELD